MKPENRYSLARSILAGDCQLAEGARLRLALALSEARGIRVLHAEPTESGRGWILAVHMAGDYRRREIICSPKWRSQFRRLGARIEV